MTTLKTFSQYFQQQALIDNLPFKIDFELTTISDHDLTEFAGGLEFKLINDLNSREEWFFSSIESINSTKVKAATMLLRNLTIELQSALDLETAEEAQTILWEGSEEFATDSRYVQFHQENGAKIEELLELLVLAQDNRALNWLRVTFFILSRSTSDWSLSQTAMLKSSAIDEIVNLIIRESNGGVDPEPVSEDESTSSVEDSEPTGK